MQEENTDGPDYGVTVEADELLADLAERAAEYGLDYEEKNRWWRESLESGVGEFVEARYWKLEARGGQRAYSEAIAAIQPGGRFRDGAHVDVRGFMSWLIRMADDYHGRSHGGYTSTRQPDEAETACSRMLSLLRDDYGVGWPRLDDVGGTPLEEDLP